ncbi:hypothetical protein C5C30_11385 [Rathayibacter sp. AY2B5]|nr:hypothetical protein C5C30_11385 [Rathayibacter sp. AY2B5]
MATTGGAVDTMHLLGDDSTRTMLSRWRCSASRATGDACSASASRGRIVRSADGAASGAGVHRLPVCAPPILRPWTVPLLVMRRA